MFAIRGPATVVLALAIAWGIAAVSCDSDEPEPPAWLPRYSGQVSGDDARLSGELVRDGNCLYVSGFLPVFPPKSTFDEHSNGLTVLGKDFAVGSEFVSGGGEVGSRFDLADLNPPDPSCDTTLVWIVGDVN